MTFVFFASFNMLIFIKWSIQDQSDLLADQHITLYIFLGVCVKLSSFIHRMLNREV